MYKSSLLQVVKKKFTIYYISFEFRKKAKDEQNVCCVKHESYSPAQLMYFESYNSA